MRRVPVDSSRDELVAEGAEAACSSTSSLDPLAHAAPRTSATRGRRRARRRAGRATSTWRSSATRDRLGDGERREQPGVLERPAEAAAGPGRSGCSVGDVVAVEHDRAVVGGQEAGDEVEQRRLAGAVGPDEPEDLARVRASKRDVVDGGDAAEALGDAADLEHDGVASAGRSTGRRTVRRRRSAPCARRRPAPSRNTERSMSGRSSSSAVGPWKRTSPFSMKYGAVGDGEGDVHRLLDEDDRRARVALSSRTISSSCSTTTGRQAERQLVDHQQPGLGDERHGRG